MRGKESLGSIFPYLALGLEWCTKKKASVSIAYSARNKTNTIATAFNR